MSWTNVPFKNPGDPVTAENWNGLVGNPAAIADAEAGAPRILVPQALRTTETDPFALLHADGAGGTRWNRPSLEYRIGANAGLTNLGTGVWLIQAMASRLAGSGSPARAWHGMALLAQGALIVNRTLEGDGNSTDSFTYDGSTVRFLPNAFDLFNAPVLRTLMAVRIG